MQNDNSLKKNKQHIVANIYHPKTLVYIIQYKSSKNITSNVEDKQTIIIGSSASKTSSSGFNLIENQITTYFQSSEQKIIEKHGFVIPCLWFICKSLYPSAKLIKL
jgi:hypothetical protein